jgi:hypothetical protein
VDGARLLPARVSQVRSVNAHAHALHCRQCIQCIMQCSALHSRCCDVWLMMRVFLSCELPCVGVLRGPTTMSWDKTTRGRGWSAPTEGTATVRTASASATTATTAWPASARSAQKTATTEDSACRRSCSRSALDTCTRHRGTRTRSGGVFATPGGGGRRARCRSASHCPIPWEAGATNIFATVPAVAHATTRPAFASAIQATLVIPAVSRPYLCKYWARCWRGRRKSVYICGNLSSGAWNSFEINTDVGVATVEERFQRTQHTASEDSLKNDDNYVCAQGKAR